VPDEPVDLKTALRASVLAGRAWGDQPPELDLVAWLWGVWGPDLDPAGIGRDRFGEVLSSAEREARLWLMGDRQWVQLVGGLAGRISRRLPPSPAEA
jgi:hypothetical protein